MDFESLPTPSLLRLTLEQKKMVEESFDALGGYLVPRLARCSPRQRIALQGESLDEAGFLQLMRDDHAVEPDFDPEGADRERFQRAFLGFTRLAGLCRQLAHLRSKMEEVLVLLDPDLEFETEDLLRNGLATMGYPVPIHRADAGPPPDCLH